MASVLHSTINNLYELETLLPQCLPSSTATLGSKVYVLNYNYAWVERNSGGGGGAVNPNPNPGTSDYNDLTNVPVINLVGNAANPVILQALAFGTYSLLGEYKYTAADVDIMTAATKLFLEVSDDNLSGNKIVKFEDYEDGERYVESIIFDGATYTAQKTYPSRSDDVIGIPELEIDTLFAGL